MKCDTKCMFVFCQETTEDNVEKESEDEVNVEEESVDEDKSEESEDDKVDKKSKQGCSSKSMELTQYVSFSRSPFPSQISLLWRVPPFSPPLWRVPAWVFCGVLCPLHPIPHHPHHPGS